MAAAAPRARRALVTASRSVRQASSPLTSEDDGRSDAVHPAIFNARPKRKLKASKPRAAGKSQHRADDEPYEDQDQDQDRDQNKGDDDEDEDEDEDNQEEDDDCDDDHDDDNPTGAKYEDSFDSGTEIDMDDTSDYIGPGESRKRKRAKTLKVKKQPKAALPKPRRVTGQSRALEATAKRRPAHRGASSHTRGAAHRDDLNIKDDIPLFNAVKNPESALQTTVEDWVIAYQSEPGPASVELINFVIRCCGCNSAIDETAVMDLDNVVDTIEEIQEDFKAASIASYPIVSRAPTLKKFKKSLAEFTTRLILTASESELLIVAPVTPSSSDDVMDHPLINILKEWLSCLSSSTFRSFRHTSTFIVLNIIESLAGLVLEKRKQVETARKQRDAEQKKGRLSKSKMQSLDENWRAGKEQEALLRDAIRDLVDSVFQHRYRDSDALIRTDCATELGRWMKAYHEMFLKNEFSRHLGWFLSDASATVRLAASRALAGLYSRSAFPDSLRYFTDLYKDRLVQMATQDVDLAVRTSTIEVLLHIDRRGLLDDELRDHVGAHIFDVEPRMRTEAARFLSGVIQEEIDDIVVDFIGPAPVSHSLAAKNPKLREKKAQWDNEVRKLKLKILARKLVAYGEAIDESDAKRVQDKHDGTRFPMISSISMLAAEGAGRIAQAIRALWSFEDDSAPFSNPATLLELLLYDHSAQTSASRSERDQVRSRMGGKSASISSASPEYCGTQPPREIYRLEPKEETVLLESLVAIVEQTCQNAQEAQAVTTPAGGRDVADLAETNRFAEVTRSVVPALAKLFAKYRTESPRVSEMLLLVPALDLSLYAATGQSATFASLWDEVSGQFLRHSEPLLLKRGAIAIRALNDSTTTHAVLSNLTHTKLSALQETLIGCLRDPLKGKELATAALDEDALFALRNNLERLAELFAATDCCESMEDSDNGLVTSGWEVVQQLGSRGKLGYEAESAMVATCLRILTIHILWRLRALLSINSATSSPEERSILASDLLKKKEECLDLLRDYIDKGNLTVSHHIRSAAAARILQIQLAFYSAQEADGALSEARAPLDSNKHVSPKLTASDGEIAAQGKLDTSLHIAVPLVEQDACVNAILAQVNHHLEALQDEEARDEDAEFTHPHDAAFTKEDCEVESRASQDFSSKETSGSVTAPNAGPSNVQNRLGREFELNQLMALLVSAARLGLVNIGLLAPLIGKHGRAGRAYDLMVKLLIEVLREEGVMCGDRQAGSVILDSLKDAFEAFLTDGSSEAEGRFISFSRSLSSALVIRGAQLTVLQAIDPEVLFKIHSKGAEYVTQKWKAAERADNKAIKARAPAFWRGLSNLLVSATARDAHRIKSAADKAIKDAGIEISSASRSWDPYRQYEKRLVTLIAKRAPVPPHVGVTPHRVAGEVLEEPQAHINGLDINVPVPEGDFDRAAPVESTPLRHRPVSRVAAAIESSKRVRSQKEDTMNAEDDAALTHTRPRSLSALTNLSDLPDAADEIMEDVAEGSVEAHSRADKIVAALGRVEREESAPAQAKRRRFAR